MQEAKIGEVLGNPTEGRFEASGVCAKDGSCYVIFDDSPRLARIGLALSKRLADNQISYLRGLPSGYEDIAYDPRGHRFYTLIEALEFSPGVFKARIEEYDDDLNYLSSEWADFPLKRENKGLEGLTCVYRDARPYLLGLCEGNKCKGGAAGRNPGRGRIQVFDRSEGEWEHVGTIKLPKSLLCEDYASLDVTGNRIVVVSQASSLLWVGTFQASGWSFTDEGRVYRFPRNHKGKSVYCNIEGVAWLASDQIVVVSDKRKPDEQAKRCGKKDQSIHIFRIPEL